MRYLNIFVFIFLMVLLCITAVAKETEDCSEISNGVFIEKTCNITVTIGNNFEIVGHNDLPEVVRKSLTLKHITETRSIGGPVKFYEETSIITSVFPPRNGSVAWSVVFDKGKFILKSVLFHDNVHATLLFIMVILVAFAILSGIKTPIINFNPIHKFMTTNLLIGVFAGGIVGVFAGGNFMILIIFIVGVFASGIVGMIINIMTTQTDDGETVIGMMITGMFIGVFTGEITMNIIAEAIAGTYDTIRNITLEWILFCTLIIIIEYTIVFYRRHKERNKLATA